MGAISADTPAVQLVTGPMSTGSHQGVRVGACTDCRGYWARYRAGEIDMEEIVQVDELVPSAGVSLLSPCKSSLRQVTCGVMGTGENSLAPMCTAD